MNEILEQIQDERERQKTLYFNGVSVIELDKFNKSNDWISFIITRLGKCGTTNPGGSNHDIGNFRTQMIKVAALAVAAIEASDNGSV